MGIVKSIGRFFENAGKNVVGGIAKYTTTPALKGMVNGPALLAEQVAPGNRFSKQVFNNTLPNAKERAGVAAENAAGLLSVIPGAQGSGVVNKALRVGQSALTMALQSGGSATSASKSNAEIAKATIKGTTLGVVFGLAAEGLSAFARSRAASRGANEAYLNSLHPDAKTRQKELELQYRDGITRFGEKVQSEYGANSLNGYIKKADGEIQKWGTAYRKRLETAYSDAVIFTDDVVNEFSDTYAKAKLGSMNEKETSMMQSLIKQYKLGATNNPARILDIKQAIDSDIPSSAWKNWKAGETISDAVEMKIFFRDALGDMLTKLNPEDAIIQTANKKMSLAFEVRRLAAVQRDAVMMSRKVGTGDAMGWFDKILARTVMSTPVKTGLASAQMNLMKNPVGIGNYIKNATANLLAPKTAMPDLENDYNFTPEQSMSNNQVDLSQYGFQPE